MGRIADTLEVVGVLAVTGAGLRLAGLEATWTGVCTLPRVSHPVDPKAAAHRIVRWGAWMPGARLCLPQAVAGAALLRRHGQRGELVIGVKHRPFGAHAWLICGGEVLLGGAEAPAHTPIWRAPV